ncbi:MAG: ATP-binding protein [Eubacteriales bacterium]|nr:ATP-binding protein [Eubacteriales bacterium]
MKRKINLQFMVVALLAILATVSLVSVVYYKLFKSEVMSNLKEYTYLIVETNSGRVASDPAHVDFEVFNHDDMKLRVTVIAPDGTAIMDTNAEIGAMDNHSKRPEIKQAVKEGEGQAVRNSSTVGKSTFYYAYRLNDGYILRVAKETGSLVSVYLSSFPLIGVLCVFLLLACFFLGHYLAKSIIDPIDLLAENLDGTDSIKVYKELVPFVNTIKRQHQDILKNADMRQEFTANVSHELKTPLTSISGYSELIESGMAGSDDVVRFAKEIHKSSNRLLTLINDIIRLSQLDGGSSECDIFESVDLYEIAKGAVDTLGFAAEKNQVELNLHGSSQIVNANRQMMDELVYNLCDNAIRYNKPQGRVDITVSQSSNKEIFVEVVDTGIGISKENQERIFERFYRVDKSRSKQTGGTGLGLAIVKHIVSQHANARLELESELNKGTSIKLIFSEK